MNEGNGIGRGESRLKQIAYVAVFVPVLGLSLFALSPDSGPTEEVYGEVLRLESVPTRKGEQHYLLVRLDSGEEIRSRIPEPSLFRRAARVRLHRHAPRLTEEPVFRFRGYVDGGA